MMTFLLIFLWVTLATVADILFKRCSNYFSWQFVLGLLMYASTAFLAPPTFHRKQFGYVVVVWITVSLVIGVSTSIIFFREPLTPKRIAACLLALSAVFVEEFL